MNRLFLLCLLLLSFPAFAATTANSVITAQTPQREAHVFSGSGVATYATVYMAGSNGSKISSLTVNSNDPSSTHVVTCGIFNSATQYGSFSVTTVSPASGSYNSLNVLALWSGLPLDGNGNPFIYLVSGDTLQCAFATTITSSDSVVVTGMGADF